MSTDAQPAPPREPPAYRPTTHFLERLNDVYDEYNRHIDSDIIEGCIRNGDVEQTGPGIYHLRKAFGGVTYTLVVNVRRSVVLTAHPVSIKLKAARRSGRWSESQIEDILEFLANGD